MLVSTRGGATASASGAILTGIAPDGGLFVPQEFPVFSMEEISNLIPLSYPKRVSKVLSRLLTDFTDEELSLSTEAAYSEQKFNGFPAPVKTFNGNTHMLELYHGPTLAFKDMALQLLPHLLSLSAKKNGVTDEICVVTATSGDTGKAALEGFCDVPGTRCIVFYPKDGVSQTQYLQMATQKGSNTSVIAVTGNFDDTQTGVKQIFGDSEIQSQVKAQNRMLTSANSINFGRLVPQIAYYFSAYADLVARKAVALGDKVHFAIPTGNFGNILAALYAKRMGLPVGKLLCASNANRVLSDFICSGTYDVNRPFYQTDSPSMDILLSSNLERYLFDLTGGDAGRVRRWMETLTANGYYAVEQEVHQALREEITGGWVSGRDTASTIYRTFHETQTLIDPHTAVAFAMLNRYRSTSHDKTPAVVVSTASPFKFGVAVARALDCAEKTDIACCEAVSRVTGQPIPESILRLHQDPILHNAICKPEEMNILFSKVFQIAYFRV